MIFYVYKYDTRFTQNRLIHVLLLQLYFTDIYQCSLQHICVS